MKSILKKVGKAIWSVLPWIGLAIWMFFIILSPVLHATEKAELQSQIVALEAQNAMYQSQQTQLDEEIDWLRSLVEQEVGNGQE